MENSLILLDYQNEIADNFSSIAYAKLFEKKSNKKIYFENSTNNRLSLEDKLRYFDLDFEYISSNRLKSIQNKAHKIETSNSFNKRIKKNNSKKAEYIKLNKFDINDLNLLNENIINTFRFKDTCFIKNYDILDSIQNNNSIGIFISSDDIKQLDKLNDFIYKATKRLNKYIKNPILYIFTNYTSKFDINSFVKSKIISMHDWKEIYFLLSKCKNHLIPFECNSYSQNIWAALIYKKDYTYTIYNSKTKKTKKHNWINVV